MLREQIHEVHQQIAEHQRATIEWQNQFKELPGDMQTLMQRQVQAETLAQQTTRWWPKKPRRFAARSKPT